MIILPFIYQLFCLFISMNLKVISSKFSVRMSYLPQVLLVQLKVVRMANSRSVAIDISMDSTPDELLLQGRREVSLFIVSRRQDDHLAGGVWTPFFLSKKWVSIWIRGNTFFWPTYSLFLAVKIGHF